MPWRCETVEASRRSFCERVSEAGEKMSEVCEEYGISRRIGYIGSRRMVSVGYLTEVGARITVRIVLLQALKHW